MITLKTTQCGMRVYFTGDAGNGGKNPFYIDGSNRTQTLELFLDRRSIEHWQFRESIEASQALLSAVKSYEPRLF